MIQSIQPIHYFSPNISPPLLNPSVQDILDFQSELSLSSSNTPLSSLEKAGQTLFHETQYWEKAAAILKRDPEPKNVFLMQWYLLQARMSVELLAKIAGSLSQTITKLVSMQ